MSAKPQVQKVYGLSPMQEGMLFHTLLDPDPALYFEQVTFRVHGRIEPEKFRESLGILIGRHESLRTSFVHQKVRQPVQVVLKERPAPFHFEDISAMAEGQQSAYWENYQEQDRQSGFNLVEDPLIRLSMIQTEAETYQVIWSFHHIIMDGWCLGIIIREFFQIYQSLRTGQRHGLEPAPPYSDYIEWLGRQDRAAASEYWRQYLAEYQTDLSLGSKSDNQTNGYRRAETRFTLAEDLSAKLQQAVSRFHVTLNTILMSAWGMLLQQYYQVPDLVFGAVVSGRPSEIGNLNQRVGLYINTIPVRIQRAPGGTILQLLKEVQQAGLGAEKYGYFPLAEIQNQSPLKQNLIKHLYIFENYPSPEELAAQTSQTAESGTPLPFTVTDFQIKEQTSYDFNLLIQPGNPVSARIYYNANVYTGRWPQDIGGDYATILEGILERPEQEISAFLDKNAHDVPSLWSSGGEKAPAAATKPISVAVAATFTAEPIREHLQWWAWQFQIEAQVEFAPYNQVFQELLDSQGLLSNNPDLNLLLVRFEDWLRDDMGPVEQRLENLERNFREFTAAFGNRRGKAGYFCGILPISSPGNHESQISAKLEELNARWGQIISETENTYPVDFRELAELYQIGQIFDPVKDKAGHMPFSDEFYAAAGTAIARKLVSWRRPPFKVLVLDCDQTLWKGICGEVGPLGVKVEAPYEFLQRFALQKKREGMLLALCSKNNESDVWEVFHSNPEMVLTPADLAGWRINWRPKSENLKELAQELNLGLDSFIFIDDDPLVCLEVMTNCPQVLSLRLPEDSALIPGYLQHVWAFDRLIVTAADRQRTQMYQEERKRREFQEENLTLDDFIRNLGLKVSLNPIVSSQVARVAQLTQRTNQFNLSTIRRTEEEIASLAGDPGTCRWVVEAADRFGDYGLVGALITRIEPEAVFIETFLLSCRVLGRKVEDTVISGLKQYCQQQGKGILTARYCPTAKNQPILEFLERTGWEKQATTAEGTVYQLAISRIPEPETGISFYYQTVWPRQSQPESGERETAVQAAPSFETVSSPAGTGFEKDWEITLPSEVNLWHASYLLPIQHHTSRQLLQLPVQTAPEGSVSRTPYVAPRNETETKLAAIWEEILGIEKPGIHDDFFKLGGHSLKATILIGRLYKEFQVEAPLRQVFLTPTIAGMAEYLTQGPEMVYVPIPTAIKQDHYPLSSAQKKLYILHQIPETGFSYNMTGAMVIEGELDRERLEKTFTELIQRHEAFRTSFHIVGGKPVQRIHPEVDVRFSAFQIEYQEVADLEGEDSNLECEDSNPRLQSIIREFVRPFDLAQAPLLRIGLLKVSGTCKHILMYDMPHIIGDGVSMVILTREFIQRYNGQEWAPLKTNYKDFAVRQNQMLESGGLEKQASYWLRQLSGDIPVLNMPLDYPRPEKRNFKGNKHQFVIGAETTQRLIHFANGRQVTLNMLMFANYALLIHQYSRQQDLIIGTLVFGREHPDLENMIGVFINFLPIRVNVNPEYTMTKFLGTVKQKLLTAYEHQNYPFEMMIAQRKLIVKPSRNPLFDTMLVFHNEFDIFSSQAGVGPKNLKFQPYEFNQETATLDLKLDIIHNANTGELNCILEYDIALFKPETIEQLAKHFQSLCEKVETIQELSGLKLFTQQEQQELGVKRDLQVKSESQAIKLAVSATFTAEPIKEYIEWWLWQFGVSIAIEFAPYNQVFQELLDPKGLLGANSDLNLLLVRFEDWLRDDPGPAEQLPDKLEQNFTEFVTAFRNRNQQALYLAPIFPVSGVFKLNPAVMAKLEELNIRWRQEITASNRAYPIDLKSLAPSYGIGEIYDALKDRVGHLPFSDGYYAVMGTVIARKIVSWKRQRFKVIVLDCDNTLWKGVCGEDGALGVKVDESYAALQRFMAQQSREGMLLALCSKNHEADVWEVLAKHPGMILRKNDLASWRINWRPKSENLKELARELNLGLDSFIFMDDNPVECAEVMANCPEVLTLRLPEPRWFSDYLNHVWAFDHFQVTAEDQSRTRMYQEEKQRQKMQTESLSLLDFLQNLELKVSLKFMEPSQIGRVAQLTERTNQFNLSTIRRTENEIQALTEDPGSKLWVVEVADRFGDYGLVGVVITREEPPVLSLDTFLLSCRVLGKNVEETILSGLQRYCRERILKVLIARYFPTAKNEPFLRFLDRSGWELRETATDHMTYHLEIENISKPMAGLEFYYRESLPGGKEPVGVQATSVSDYAHDVETASSVEPVYESISGDQSETWQVEAVPELLANVRHQSYLLPLKYHTAQALLKLPVKETQDMDLTRAEYVAPRNQTEQRLTVIWEELLQVERIGVTDNFFKLGGHSLTATSLISRLHQAFQVEVSLRQIFETPTIAGLAKYLQPGVKSRYASIPVASEQEYYSSGSYPPGCYPASAAQKRIYILYQIDPGNLSYNMPGAYMVEGNLNRDRLRETFRILIKRHEAFRTSFEMIDGEPVQRIHPEADFMIEACEGEDDVVRDGHARSLQDITHGFIQPFDLKTAPLLRVGLISLGAAKHLLIFDMSHIISDGTSMMILIKEFIETYEGKALPELRIQYKDFAIWQNELLQSEALKRQEKYWLDHFQDEIPVINLPTDYPRPAVQSFEGDRIQFTMGPELTRKCNQLAAQTGTTLYMILLAAYNILLAKYTGQEDIIVGSPIAGRPHADLERIIGVFINTLAMRNQPEGDQTVTDFLARVKEHSIKAYENQDYQFEELVLKLNLPRDLSRNPLFDVMFILQNQLEETREIAGLRLLPYELPNKTAKFDLTLQAVEGHEGIQLTLEYCARLFQAETMLRFSRHFLNVCEGMTAQPSRLIRDLEILSPDEQRQILFDFNHTQSAFDLHQTISELFAAQAGKTPEQTALVFQGAQLTYGELNRKANQLALFLRAKGIQPDQIVGLMVERSFEMMIGILGVLKAGAAYLPIDPGYPPERVRYLLEDSHTEVLLTQGRFTAASGFAQGLALAGLPFNGEVIDVEDETIYRGAGLNLPAAHGPQNIAYVIYTSGSTGKPKGVMIEHRTVANFRRGMMERIPFTPGQSILCLTTYTFDIFVLETLTPLSTGLLVVIADEEQQKSPEAVKSLVLERRIRMLQATPSRMQMLLMASGFIEQLETLIIGGEAFPVELYIQLRKLASQAKIYNVYGPTETTVWSTLKELTSPESVNIGKPIANTRILIVNQNGQPQPVGVPGELCIAGAGLARGYLNRPELTVEKFIPNPFFTGVYGTFDGTFVETFHETSLQQTSLQTSPPPIYRTGDLARWLPDGEIQFLGRLDHQIKIRGFRIELGEIETRLVMHPAVQEAVVIARDNPRGDKELCAFVVGHSNTGGGETGPKLETPELREFLAETLPDYMIPVHFIHLEQLPLTPNGKINRKALIDSGELAEWKDQMDARPEYAAPRNEMERKLADIWQEMLGVAMVGIDDNFYDLGGHSLIAIGISDKAKQLGLNITMRDILSFKTISRIANNIDGAVEPGISPELSREPLDSSRALVREGSRQYDIAGPDIKELPVKFELDYTSYLHYSLPFAVVLADERLAPWFYENFINIFTCMGYWGVLRFDFLEYEFSRNQFMTSIQFNHELLADLPDVVPFLLDKINHGYYAIINVDEYYLSEKEAYQKEHFVHPSLIYGYHHPDRRFLAIGFDQVHLHTKISLDYDQFAEAYENVKAHLLDTAPWAEKKALELLRFKNHQRSYPFDLGRFLGRLDDYLAARGDNSVIYHYELPDEDVAYGVAVYDEVVRHLKYDLKNKRLTLDYIGIHFLAEHKKGIYNRLRYVACRYGAPDDLLKMIDEYYPIVEQFEVIRIKCMEFSYGLDRSGLGKFEKVVKETIELIESIQAKERPLLSEIAKRLKHLL